MSAVLSTGLRQRLEETAERLAEVGIESPRAEAEGLLAAAIGPVQRHTLYLEERDLTGAEQQRLQSLVRRRLAGEPLQYITGEAAFRMLTLKVDRRALIPRPETEGLVGTALRLMGSQEQVVALDAGTGSGAIALAVAAERPSWSVLAADLSPAALDLARENAARLGLGRVQWLEADITNLVFWRGLPVLDLVIANPPYVATGEWAGLAREITEHEPTGALLAGESGLDVIAPLLEGASMRVKPGGLVVIEIGDTQGEAVTGLARANGLVDVRVAPDLSARPRYLIAEQRRSPA
jgi:release factor glutamine methyltransferase